MIGVVSGETEILDFRQEPQARSLLPIGVHGQIGAFRFEHVLTKSLDDRHISGRYGPVAWTQTDKGPQTLDDDGGVR